MSTSQNPVINDLRHTARDIFLTALKEANIDSAFKRHIEYSRGVLLFHSVRLDTRWRKRCVSSWAP
jgi:hypothetical protein